MGRGRIIALGLMIVAVIATTFGCSKVLDQFREKHPDPPAGVFPTQVGKMVIEQNERWGKNPNCTRADPLHCWGYYIVPGGDSETTRIHYYMQIYDSPDEANARLDEYYHQRVSADGDKEENSWEDRVDKNGQKVGRVVIKNTVHREDDHMLGFCSVSYTKGTWFITIYHGYECDPARQFMKDLTAITN